MRPDKRQRDELRPISLAIGELNRPDSAVRFKQADTSVFAAVYGPIAAPLRDERLDRAVLQVEFRTASGKQDCLYDFAFCCFAHSGSAHELVAQATLIQQALEPLVLLHNFPRSLINVIVQIVHDDGSILAAAINASICALLTSGIPLRDMAAACTLGLTRDVAPHDDDAQQSRYSLIVDPSREEELVARCLSTFVFTANGPSPVFNHAIGVCSTASDAEHAEQTSSTASSSSTVTTQSSIALYLEQLNQSQRVCSSIINALRSDLSNTLKNLRS